MTERYYFFNSGVGDPRVYEASHFAEYFNSVLSTGLLHTDEVPGMEVSVETGTLNTIVSAGKGIMKGRFYENTSSLTLTHDIPEVALDRIDRIILRLNLSNAERNIRLMVLSGASSATPVAPALVRDNFIYDISLAQILVRANTVQLLQTDLVDERLDESLCGLVYSLISIPTDQLQTFIIAKMAELDVEVDDFEAQLAQNLLDYETEFNTWFDNLQSTGYATPESVQAVEDALSTHQAEKASSTTLGHVQIGDGITVNANGVISVAEMTASNVSTSDGGNVQTEIESLKQSVSNGKILIRDTITGKGGAVADSTGTGIPSYQDIADGVNALAVEFPQRNIIPSNYDVVGTDSNGDTFVKKRASNYQRYKYDVNGNIVRTFPLVGSAVVFNDDFYTIQQSGTVYTYNNQGTLLHSVAIPYGLLGAFSNHQLFYSYITSDGYTGTLYVHNAAGTVVHTITGIVAGQTGGLNVSDKFCTTIFSNNFGQPSARYVFKKDSMYPDSYQADLKGLLLAVPY